MCAVLHKGLYFSKTFIDPFRRFIYMKSTRSLPERRGKTKSIRRPKPEADKPLNGACSEAVVFTALSSRLVNIRRVFFSCDYIIVTTNGTYSLKYTIKNLTSSKADNLLFINLAVSASSASSSSGFRSENSRISSMLSESLSPTETNPESGADVQILLTYL